MEQELLSLFKLRLDESQENRHSVIPDIIGLQSKIPGVLQGSRFQSQQTNEQDFIISIHLVPRYKRKHHGERKHTGIPMV